MRTAGESFGACTIATPAQFAAARVLARSFALHHPEIEFTILLLGDDSAEALASGVPARVLPLRDLHAAPLHPYQLPAAYDSAALARITKPLLLKQLFESGTEVALYFDPGVWIFSELLDAVRLTREAGIALTPLARCPVSHDRHQVKDRAGIWSGTFDLGFLGVRNDQKRFLELWSLQMAEEYNIDHEYHADIRAGSRLGQRWLDAAPTMFGCATLSGPGYDVAYWNLGERDLKFLDDRYFVADEPLQFFNFQGFDPARDYLLTTDDHAEPHVSLSDRPVLRRICREYGQRLFDEGWTAKNTYPFDLLPGEVPLDQRLRRLFRTWQEEKSSTAIDPFSANVAKEFLYDIANPKDDGSLPPLIVDEYRRRPDLQTVYPHPDGRSRNGLIEWARAEVGYGRLHPLLAPASGPASDGEISWAKAPDLREGVCIAGYLRAELGLGQQARLLVDTVKRAAIPYGTYVFRLTLSRQAHPFAEQPANDLNTNIISVVPDQLERFVDEVGEDFLKDRYNIGFWAWELKDFPAHSHAALKYVDEIWAISDFTRSSFAAITDKPVCTFPNPIVAPALPKVPLDRSHFGLPGGYLFLFVFDFFSEMERKNPLGLITAFCAAFKEGQGPVLVIKTINGQSRPHELEHLKVAAADRTDVIIIDRYLDFDEQAALMATCDCYVSLHRAEGFGLTLAEAMALGKPAIATGFSGNLEFMTDENSFLVPWEESRVPPGCGPYPEGSRWAEPDLDEAARIMRHVYLDRDDAARRAALARTIVERHGIDARAAFLQDRFRHAQEALQSRRQPPSAPLPDGKSGVDVSASQPRRSRPARLIFDLLGAPRL